jgi:hypothetical protein
MFQSDPYGNNESDPYGKNSDPYGNNQDTEAGDGAWTKGEKQPSAFKDIWAAVLFVAHLVAIVAVAVMYGVDAFSDVLDDAGDNADGGDGQPLDYASIGKAAAAVGVASLLLASLMLNVMMKCAESLIKFSLLFSVAMAGLFAVASLLFGNIIGAIFGFIFFAISVCYAKAVWSRIPFATANLVTSLTAVKANFGVTFLGYLVAIKGFAWSILWTVALVGVYSIAPEVDDCNNGVDQDGNECAKQLNYVYLFLLFLSFYWTHQVLTNIIHTTVSGVVGTWWFVPAEASSFCSSAITSSVCRSCTYSFGSICFGSLIVAIIQALRATLNEARKNDDINGFAGCIIDCLLGLLESIAEYFNQWAYVYVGLYGYGYIEAGKNVMALFKNRGWDVVIADDLVGNALGLTALMTGCLMGVFGLVLESSTDWFKAFRDDFSQPGAFLVAFLMGLVIASICFNIVGSAVNAVIVLFAEAPAEFADNHPDLSNQMRQAYLEAYPDLF